MTNEEIAKKLLDAILIDGWEFEFDKEGTLKNFEAILTEATSGECEWKKDSPPTDYIGIWVSGCRNITRTNENFTYCPYCGKKIKEVV